MVKAIKTPKKTPKEAPKYTSASVYKNGKIARTFSLGMHGKDFEKLAEQYAGKISGKVISK